MDNVDSGYQQYSMDFERQSKILVSYSSTIITHFHFSPKYASCTTCCINLI